MEKLYDFLLKDNAKLLERMFIEKQSGNIKNIIELLKEFKKNSMELYNIEKAREKKGVDIRYVSK